MISHFNPNSNTLPSKKVDLLKIIEDSIKKLFKRNSSLNRKKDRYIYIPPAGASVPRAATMSFLCKKVQEKFLDNKKNSCVYSSSYVCKTGILRKRRLSRRETLCLFQQILISSYSIGTGEIYSNIVYKEFAKYAEVSERTIKRLFSLFKKRGWIEVIQHKKLDKYGNYFSTPATKYLRKSYFEQALGKWAWKKVEQYKKVWERDHGVKTIENSTQIDINRPKDWKEEALDPYLKERKSYKKESLKIKGINLGIGNTESYAYRTNQYQEDAADPSKIQIAPVHVEKAYTQEDDRQYVPQHASHKDFVSPAIDRPIEEIRASGRSHMAAIMAKLGRPPTAPP